MADIGDLLRSHDELRAALLVAGKRIRQLNFERKHDPVLAMLRKALREARVAPTLPKRTSANALFGLLCLLSIALSHVDNTVRFNIRELAE